jgi:uncharacterized protein YcnI
VKRYAVVAGLVAALVAVTAAPAAAHVTVTAPGVTVGASDAQITFRVPDESDTASTVALAVQLPTDHPLLGVLVAPVPGWTSKVVQTKLAKPIATDDGTITSAVSRIEWTSSGKATGIKPGQFGAFTIIAGQLPEGVASLTFPAIQSYSDGKQVKWIQVAAPGSTATPDFPAPVLQLAVGGDGASAVSDASNSTTGATVLSIVALVLAVIALGYSVWGTARRRRQ